MSFFDKIFGWMGKAFSFVDHIVDAYNEIKKQLPGLLALIEGLYNSFRPRVEDPDDPLTGEEAGKQLVDTVVHKFANSKPSIRRSFVEYVLKIVHMKNTQKETAYSDRPDIKAQANRVLKGLFNIYGDR